MDVSIKTLVSRDLTGGFGAWLPITNEASKTLPGAPQSASGVGLLRSDLYLSQGVWWVDVR